MDVRAAQRRAVHGEHRVEATEGGCQGSRDNQTGISPPAAPFVRHAPDRARHGLENRERAVGTQAAKDHGAVRPHCRYIQE